MQKNGPGPKPGTAPDETTTTSHHHEADGQFHITAGTGHRRWAGMVRRSPRLDCGCRDLCHCTPPPLSGNQIDAWADCARYIIDTSGCLPILPVEVLRALYRRGGDDRRLAEKLREAGAVR